ncbi:hypothetical protein SETIT_8G078200v2 [Setaria italica]|uniref:Uncharacterized protein n=1 Tax=Setaria italica TaxID=4555 RepID=A0A368S5A2_SETIT|nr:hypothetical protein SETIT_8G078200v2 [Setaria italica]
MRSPTFQRNYPRCQRSDQRWRTHRRSPFPPATPLSGHVFSALEQAKGLGQPCTPSAFPALLLPDACCRSSRPPHRRHPSPAGSSPSTSTQEVQ